MTVPAIQPDAVTRHESTADGLAAAAEFIRRHPELPLYDVSNPLDVCIFGGTDTENQAEVDRIAGILGVKAVRTGRRYQAVIDFGGGVAYSVTALDRKYSEEQAALQSYSGCVQPEVTAA